jgi:hypothetical protein
VGEERSEGLADGRIGVLREDDAPAAARQVGGIDAVAELPQVGRRNPWKSAAADGRPVVGVVRERRREVDVSAAGFVASAGKNKVVVGHGRITLLSQ